MRLPTRHRACPPRQRVGRPAAPRRQQGGGNAMAQSSDEPGAHPANDMRETSVARLMTSTSIEKHPTAFLNTGLPILQDALDVARMNEHLGPMLAPLAYNGSTPSITYAKLLAYKQGNRGLIQYEVAGTERGAGGLVFGKLYPDTNQAARVYKLMHT